MKKFKKLIPALCMLLVSAVMLGSTTFAWFSMNRTVTAGNMQINATTNEPYLLISNASNGTFGTNATMTLDPTTEGGTPKLKLVTPLNVASNVEYYATAANATANTPVKTTPTKFTNAASVLWGTASSTNPGEVQKTNIPNLVGGTGFDNGALSTYVQKSELFFKVAATDQKGANLKCSKVTFGTTTNTIAGSLRVLLVTEDGKYQLFKYGAGGVITTAETGSDAALIATVDTTALKVTAYFYFDGTDDAAYTNNATTLADVTVSFEFTIDA